MTATPQAANTFFGLDVSQLGSQLMSFRRRLSKRLLLLEFSASGLRYAEAAPSLDGIRFSHVSRVPLPEEALDRGVPSDPSTMASLIRELCQEKGIPAHRAAVVLSPDIAYQRIIQLPFALTVEEARAYLLASTNDVPLPFPLEQTDFDLYPLPPKQGSSSQPYLLIAIPQTLIDRVISLLDEAGFELQALELGPFSLLRFVADELIGLCDSELHLVLELLPDCSQLCVVSSSGPVRFDRLSAIRDFPDPELDDIQRKEALDAGLSAEEMTLKDERYLPISELDLRAVLRDVKALISELTAEGDSTVVRGLSLSGINSAHPLIKDFFEEALGCDVKVIKPVLMSRVSGFSPDDLLVQAGLARLIGLGLSFLPREQLLSCHLPDISQPSTLAPLPSLAVEAIIDSKEQQNNPDMDPLDVEVTQISSVDLSVVDGNRSLSDAGLLAEEGDVIEEEEKESEGEEEWPSLGLVVEEKEEDVKAEGGDVIEEEEMSLSLDAEHQSFESVDSEDQRQENRSEMVFDDQIDDSSESSSLGPLRFRED
jgi:Tfp pilus assembly PilM family ATPase